MTPTTAPADDLRIDPRIDLGRLVVDAARRDPAATAVAGPDATLTYRELDAAADALARTLSAAGVRRGDRVVIWLDKSTAAVVAMQAALRLAAVYVPLDGSNPPPRAARIATNCAAAILVTSSDRAEGLRAADLAPAPVHVLDGIPVPGGLAAGMGPTGEPPVRPEPVAADDLAYILYTSGSTGEPKGVCITHGNAAAFVRWAAGEIGARPDDRFANHAPFTFDLSVLDLYVAFLVGASVHLIPSSMAYAPRQLTAFLTGQGITVWYSVPSALVLMVRDGGLLDGHQPPSLRALLFAGEPFPTTYLAQLWRGWAGVRFLNLYGPTETNVCTFHEVTDGDVESGRPLPIGRACSGDDVWARHPDGSPAIRGEEGELVVSGPTVMAGYWGRGPTAEPYATGDVVRVRADRSFEYVGRRDHMVKVRGHRVELGEIEAALAAHPAVGEAAVVVSGGGSTARLEAFVVAQGDPPGLLGLKRHCAGLLPRYMIIDGVSVVDTLPRTANGKTDRRKLAALTVGRPD